MIVTLPGTGEPLYLLLAGIPVTMTINDEEVLRIDSSAGRFEVEVPLAATIKVLVNLQSRFYAALSAGYGSKAAKPLLLYKSGAKLALASLEDVLRQFTSEAEELAEQFFNEKALFLDAALSCLAAESPGGVTVQFGKKRDVLPRQEDALAFEGASLVGADADGWLYLHMADFFLSVSKPPYEKAPLVNYGFQIDPRAVLSAWVPPKDPGRVYWLEQGERGQTLYALEIGEQKRPPTEFAVLLQTSACTPLGPKICYAGPGKNEVFWGVLSGKTPFLTKIHGVELAQPGYFDGAAKQLSSKRLELTAEGPAFLRVDSFSYVDADRNLLLNCFDPLVFDVGSSKLPVARLSPSNGDVVEMYNAVKLLRGFFAYDEAAGSQPNTFWITSPPPESSSSSSSSSSSDDDDEDLGLSSGLGRITL